MNRYVPGRIAGKKNMTGECDMLDAYLSGDLPADAAKLFTQHLKQCESCREAVEQQHWIENQLRSNVVASLEPVPPDLCNTLRKSITQRRQTAHRIACGLAAAATLAIVAVGWTLQSNHLDNSRNPNKNRAGDHVASSSNETHNASPFRATFVSNGDAIAVPLESADDNVTIVQLYPTTETVRRTRNELTLELLFPEFDGG
jgi:predicted anti-sigma-YlaC factor YlaD